MLLMTFATKSLASVSAVTTRLTVKGFAAVASIPRAIVHRRELMQLTEFDERGLKDIGLTRADVEGALAISLLADPSRVLASRSALTGRVASARRDEALRQSMTRIETKPAAVAQPATSSMVACSA